MIPTIPILITLHYGTRNVNKDTLQSFTLNANTIVSILGNDSGHTSEIVTTNTTIKIVHETPDEINKLIYYATLEMTARILSALKGRGL